MPETFRTQSAWAKIGAPPRNESNMRHFLQYWKNYNSAKELGTPLDFAASAQFKKLKPGDTLWIVALKQQRLTLLGRLLVGEVVSRRLAIKQLGDRVYDAPLVALANPGTDRAIIEADIHKLASQLRFQSLHDRLSVHDSPLTQQLQSLRELTPKTARLLRSVLDSSGAQGQKHYPRRVLFARVGWMKYYAGPQTGDEKPIGGGENNKKNIGHELFNFTNFGGNLFGFVRAADRRINLERIDPTSKGESLSDVLVVFVAAQRIVGWYRVATVHKTEVKFPSDVSKDIRERLKQAGTKNFRLERHSFECPTKNAVLLPMHERTHEIPGAVKGGFGQYNVCYPYQNSGKRKAAPWINEAVSYILSYDKDNLLKNPNADNESEETATMSQEQAAGFQSNPVIRRAVEDFAMGKAHSALVKRHYRNFRDTSKSKPYDYTCERGGKNFFVEVKGTQTLGKTLILTRGEVKHIGAHPGRCILVLVHSVKASGNGTANGDVRVSGGTTEVKEPWRLRPADLSPIQYAWRVN